MASTRHLYPVLAFILFLLFNSPGAASGFVPGSCEISIAELEEGSQGDEYAHLMRQWKELYAMMLKEEKDVQNNFRAATNAQFKAGEQVRIAESNKKIVDAVRLATLQDDYDNSVEKLKVAKLRQKEFKSLLEKAKKLNLKPLDITQKKYSKMRSEYNVYLSTYTPERKMAPETVPEKPSQPESKISSNKPKAQPSTVPKESQKKKPEQPVESKKTAPVEPKAPQENKNPAPVEPKSPSKKPVAITTAAGIESQSNIIDPAMVDKRPSTYDHKAYTSQPYACVYETDTTDLATRLTRRELAPSILFTHTDPDLRPYFKDKELITCRGRLSMIGPYMYFTIEFQIASSHSQSNFGSLQEGSLLRLKLMNDTNVSLYNLKTDEGRIDPYTGYTIFVAQYAIGKQEMKSLRSSELDKMRVMWSTGFEDYDVYNIDLLINQINCLMSRK